MNDALSWEKIVGKIFWLLLIMVCGYASKQLSSLSANISELNTKMAVVVEKLTSSQSKIDEHSLAIRDHEKRLIILEKN